MNCEQQDASASVPASLDVQLAALTILTATLDKVDHQNCVLLPCHANRLHQVPLGTYSARPDARHAKACDTFGGFQGFYIMHPNIMILGNILSAILWASNQLGKYEEPTMVYI